MFQEYAAHGRLEPWQDAVSSVLFPVATAAEAPEGFIGCLRSWDMGSAAIARMASCPIRYTRDRQHLAADEEEILLLSFAARSDIAYSQDGLELLCRPRQCLVERSHRPSLFVQTRSDDLWVLKVPLRSLKHQIRAVDQLSSLVTDVSTGPGGLLHDMIRLAPARMANAAGRQREGIGQALIDLLVLALEGDVRALNSGQSSVRRAHMARVENHVRRHLADPALSAEAIAGACGISVRYLHDLFKGDGPTLGQWIRLLRLEAARDQLADPARAEGIAEVAYRWGFGDPAQFSRVYRRQFGHSPREAKAAARREQAGAN